MVFLGAGDDTFRGTPATAATPSKGRAAGTRWCSTARTSRRTFDLSANGDRARFTRDVGGITMDLDGIEEIDLNALGGADTITVNDQSATGLNTFNVDLDGSAASATTRPTPSSSTAPTETTSARSGPSERKSTPP